MLKRGQVQQIFVYFTILVVVILIVIFGFKSISNLSKNNKKTELLRFKIRLEKDLEAVSNDVGSIEYKEYNLPSDYNKLCLVDPILVNTKYINDSFIKDSLRNGLNDNVFLIGDGVPTSFYIDALSLKFPPFYICFKAVNHRVKLKIEGAGDKAVVWDVSPEICKKSSEKDSRLCPYLDFLMGTGYKLECCKNYGVCC